MNPNIDIQGHRGCRGLRPENTIMAFKKAIELGVTTLELDLVVNRDGDVIISHEPFFNHEISTGPNGEEITEENEKDYNMYNMSVEEIQSHDVGLKAHPRFPHQKKVAAQKPTLAQMVAEIEEFVKKENYPSPEYNLEIKRLPQHDTIYHPDMKSFADIVCQEVKGLGIAERSTIQSFDVETLQYVHDTYSELRLVLLIMNKNSHIQNLELLGFKPWAYSPYFLLVNDSLIQYGQKEEVRIIPWTVNEEKDINSMLDFGVDGIISDYPDRVVELVAARSSAKK